MSINVSIISNLSTSGVKYLRKLRVSFTPTLPRQVTLCVTYFEKTCVLLFAEPEQIFEDRFTQVVFGVGRVAQDVVDVHADHLDGSEPEQECLCPQQHGHITRGNDMFRLFVLY